MNQTANNPRWATRLIFLLLPILMFCFSWEQLNNLVAASPPTSISSPEAFPDPVLIKDINAHSDGSSPRNFVNFNGVIFFVAYETTRGYQLWQTDGTITGTNMVKLINPEGNAFNGADQPMLQSNGLLFFAANDGVHGYELWKSDGTDSGTTMVKDINPLGDAIPSYSIPRMVLVGSTLYLAASNGVNGMELWKSDGTEMGTIQVAEINTNGDAYPESLTAVGGELYFSAESGVSQRELWRSNGTEAGTTLVADSLNVGIWDPENLTAYNNLLFFSANNSNYGNELWQSDGTTSGTVLVRNIDNSPGQSYPANLTISNNKLFFTAETPSTGIELWQSDGTYTGTVIIRDIFTGTESSEPQYLFDTGNDLVFSANDGVHGRELWVSDGTQVGTHLIKDINPTGDSVDAYLSLAMLTNTLFFNANDGVHGVELWQSDGSSGGTELVVDIHPTSGSNPTHMTAANDALYFQADYDRYDFEPFVSDGTAIGTRLIRNINTSTGGSGAASSYNFHLLVPTDDKLFFAANDGSGAEIWVSDHTATGTVAVTDLTSPGMSCCHFRDIAKGSGNSLFYVFESSGSNNSLWKMDILTYTSTLLLTNGTNIGCLTPVNELMFFCQLTINGDELWVTDGSMTGTMMLLDDSGFYSAAFNDSLYFYHLGDLWKSDGTVTGTVQVTFINSATNASVPIPTREGERPLSPHDAMQGLNDSPIIASGGQLFFSMYDATHGTEAWVSDGTTAGSHLIKDINPGSGSSGYHYFTAVDDRVYFAADDGQHGQELWVSDGTEEGTYLVKDINPNGDSYPVRLEPGNDRLFFIADDGIHGEEIWVSDSTEAGTFMVKDINPNSNATTQFQTTQFSLNNFYFISLDDGIHGVELWVSDGTNEGTFLVSDLNPYGSAFDFYVGPMNGSADFLYFPATDGFSGNEIWHLDLGLISEYAIAFGNDGQLSGVPGQTVTYTLMLTNTSSVTDSVGITSTTSWTVNLPIDTFDLAPGESRVVEVGVEIPITARDGNFDTAVITATSNNDPNATGTAVLTTTAYVFTINLPVILRP